MSTTPRKAKAAKTEGGKDLSWHLEDLGLSVSSLTQRQRKELLFNRLLSAATNSSEGRYRTPQDLARSELQILPQAALQCRWFRRIRCVT
eukprot:scaffold1850_cov194-Pinguiococcus_pyrenoidosus.AAC.1